MPRKNIFDYNKLTLDLLGDDCFILKKEENYFGSKYCGVERVQNLIESIKKEMEKTEHSMDYQLKEFNITQKAQEKLESKVTEDFIDN
tara:strand:- start:322 stop:585 length:264 start_codon:yes stop_codon:yes gene_type:complete